MKSFNLYAIILFLFIQIKSKLISFPFRFINKKTDFLYNSTNFFDDYFQKELILDFNIGTPPQKINALLDIDSACITFKKNNQNNYIKKYSPNKSLSFQIDYSKTTPFFNLKYATDLLNCSENENNYNLSFLIEDYSRLAINDTYLPIIGLHNPYLYLGQNIFPCPHLIYDLKNKKIIEKAIWTIKYKDSYDGVFIIGGDLFDYNPIKFPKSQYSSLYFTQKFSIIFNSIYIQKLYMNYNISYFESKEANININSGLIIGTNEYKNSIDKIFFDRLINKGICKIDLLKYISNNDNDLKFSYKDYYVYYCYQLQFTGQQSQRYQTINYYEEFPNLILSSKTLEYNFVLTNKDLFNLILGRYYFLVIFQKRNNTKDKEEWYLGEPFYKKYTFSINLEAKTVGFYIPKEKTNNNNNLNKTNDDNDIKKSNYNYNYKKIIKYIIEIIIGFSLLLIAYYIGVTVRERRRKRANELKDDNYEYIVEKNKEINEDNKDSKKQQFIELNGKLGL